MVTLPSAAKEAWKKVEVYAKNAVVYLDAPASEILHWAGGISLISSCYCLLDFFATDSQTMVSHAGRKNIEIFCAASSERSSYSFCDL